MVASKVINNPKMCGRCSPAQYGSSDWDAGPAVQCSVSTIDLISWGQKILWSKNPMGVAATVQSGMETAAARLVLLLLLLLLSGSALPSTRCCLAPAGNLTNSLSKYNRNYYYLQRISQWGHPVFRITDFVQISLYSILSKQVSEAALIRHNKGETLNDKIELSQLKLCHCHWISVLLSSWSTITITRYSIWEENGNLHSSQTVFKKIRPSSQYFSKISWNLHSADV